MFVMLGILGVIAGGAFFALGGVGRRVYEDPACPRREDETREEWERRCLGEHEMIHELVRIHHLGEASHGGDTAPLISHRPDQAQHGGDTAPLIIHGPLEPRFDDDGGKV